MKMTLSISLHTLLGFQDHTDVQTAVELWRTVPLLSWEHADPHQIPPEGQRDGSSSPSPTQISIWVHTILSQLPTTQTAIPIPNCASRRTMTFKLCLCRQMCRNAVFYQKFHFSIKLPRPARTAQTCMSQQLVCKYQISHVNSTVRLESMSSSRCHLLLYVGGCRDRDFLCDKMEEHFT